MAIAEAAGAIIAGMKASPILATGLGVWGAAMLTFVTKDIPRRVADFFKREFTTSVTVGIRERELVALTQWVSNQRFSKRSRSFHLRDQTVTAADGIHLFFYKNHLCWFERPGIKGKEVVVNVGERQVPSEILFGYFGRDRTFLIELFKVSTDWDPTKKSETHIFSPRWCDWKHVASQPKRDLQQLILPSKTSSDLRAHLDWFFASSDWFRSNGIPYRTGICLYGPPGTGKTSLVRAIASQWDLSIYSVDFSNLDDAELKEIIWKVGPKALILIEDIDTIPGAKLRDSQPIQEDRNVRTKKIDVTLGGLLNAIDGVVDSDGRVFVMTTNHIEQIDPALLRPGRINLSLKLDYMTPEMFRRGFARFFPDFDIGEQINWRTDASPALFQSLVFNNLKNPNFVLSSLLQNNDPVSELPELAGPNVFTFRKIEGRE